MEVRIGILKYVKPKFISSNSDIERITIFSCDIHESNILAKIIYSSDITINKIQYCREYF